MTENYPDYLFEEAERRQLANKTFPEMTEQQKETAEYLTQQFLYWAQNNEMIDTEYLQHGKDLLTAVSLFEELND